MAISFNALSDKEMEEKLKRGYIWRCGSCHNEVKSSTAGPRGRFCHACQDYGSLVDPNAR